MQISKIPHNQPDYVTFYMTQLNQGTLFVILNLNQILLSLFDLMNIGIGYKYWYEIQKNTLSKKINWKRFIKLIKFELR